MHPYRKQLYLFYKIEFYVRIYSEKLGEEESAVLERERERKGMGTTGQRW